MPIMQIKLTDVIIKITGILVDKSSKGDNQGQRVLLFKVLVINANLHGEVPWEAIPRRKFRVLR